MGRPAHILHVHSTFALGGKEARAVRLMNAFGDAASHMVLSGVPGALGARDAIDPRIAAEFPEDHPPLVGRPSPARYRALSRFMRRYDLVLTYNWGAMDAVMARRLFGGPPLIHHEDGFNADEAGGQKRERILFRRLALPGADRLVVPSFTLEDIARRTWRQPARRVSRIANGIAIDDYGAAPRPDAIPGFVRQEGRVTVGTVAGLRPVKKLDRLLRAVALAGDDIDLVIVGEGPERDALIRESRRLGIAERVVLPGFLPRPHEYVGLFDIFALSSESEQQPISLIEAMAAGLPAASTAVGDIPRMVSGANVRFLVPPGDEAGLARALRELADAAPLRRQVGAANRERARDEFSEEMMIAAYRTLYSDVMGPSQGTLRGN